MAQLYLSGYSATTLPIPLSPNALQIDLLVVAGGGASNISYSYAGGGAGRVVECFGILVRKNQSYTVTVGSAGQNSSFSSLFAQAGGASASGITPAQIGGSGGGGGGGVPAASAIFPSSGGYNGNSVEDTAFIQTSGNPGGEGYSGYGTGGGGGAASKGGNCPGIYPPAGAPASFSGDSKGGSAILSNIRGTSTYYGAGGGGVNVYPTWPAGPNSQGFGWRGVNSGSGGTYPNATVAPLSPQPTLGQSGIVIVAYRNTYALATTTGNAILYSASNPLGANATRTGYHVYEFTGSGTITFN